MIHGEAKLLQIYVDEAGTDESSPVTVVAAVIVVPTQSTALADRIDAIKDKYVPRKQRDGYILHATDIFSRRNGHESWEISDRVNLMKTILRVFYERDVPFAIGACFRSAEGADHDKYAERLYPTIQRILGINAKVNGARYRHTLALMKCLDSVDQFIRNFGPPDASGIVLAEDVPNSKELLANFTELVRQRSDGRAGPKLERITGGLDFAVKGAHPFLELADMLAFTARRYLSNQLYGEELMNSIQPYMTSPMGEWGQHYLSSRYCFPRLDEARDCP